MADACPSCCLGCVVCTSYYSRMCAATTPQVPFTTSTFPIIYFVSRNQYFSWALLSIFLETTEKNAYAKFLRGQTKCIMWMQKRWIFYPGALPFDGERSSELGNSTQASISDWFSFERMKQLLGTRKSCLNFQCVGSSCKAILLGNWITKQAWVKPQWKLCIVHFTSCCDFFFYKSDAILVRTRECVMRPIQLGFVNWLRLQRIMHTSSRRQT